MKTLWKTPVSTPPDKNGYYYTNEGELIYDKKKNEWCDSVYDGLEYPKFYYSESMPPELAKVLEEVKKQLELHPTTDLFISPQEAQTILKYL